jgi:nucleoside-diphosphate kinase
MERTLVLLKPDAIDRGLVGEILQRFEKVGLKLAGLKMIHPDEELAKGHYTEDLAVRRGQKVRDIAIGMLTESPIVAICLEGVEAVELVRKLVGTTEPKSAAPGTIRGDYSHVSFSHADSKNVPVYNLVHASGSVEEANQEIAVWFKEGELYDHKPAYVKRTIHY